MQLSTVHIRTSINLRKSVFKDSLKPDDEHEWSRESTSQISSRHYNSIHKISNSHFHYLEFVECKEWMRATKATVTKLLFLCQFSAVTRITSLPASQVQVTNFYEKEKCLSRYISMQSHWKTCTFDNYCVHSIYWPWDSCNKVGKKPHIHQRRFTPYTRTYTKLLKKHNFLHLGNTSTIILNTVM